MSRARLAAPLVAALLVSAATASAQEPPASPPPVTKTDDGPIAHVAAPEPPPPAHRRGGLFVGLDAGGFVQRMLDTPVHGIDVDVAIGGDFPRDGLGGLFALRVQYARGWTASGLDTGVLRVGGEGGFVLDDRVRLGGGLTFGQASFVRATNGESVTQLVAGVTVFGSVDVLHVDEQAVVATLRANTDTADVKDASLCLGVRF